MQNNAIAIIAPPTPSMGEVEALKEICKVAAYSGFLSSTAPRNDMTWRTADAFFVVMYGRELGIPAMTALKTIYVVDGKPSCSGQALLALMRRAGVEVEIPDPSTVTDKATVRIRRPGGEWREYTYTKKMAEDAGLWGRNTWSKYWREMLIWRAVSTANKYETSDITGGLYTIEELAPNTPLDADGAPTSAVVISKPDAAPQRSEPPFFTGEEPSSAVRGAGLQQPPKFIDPTPEELERIARDVEEVLETDLVDAKQRQPEPPTTDDDAPPNVYAATALVVNKTRSAIQFILKSGETNFVINDYPALENLSVNGIAVPELQAATYPLDPAWQVHADKVRGAWEVYSITAPATTEAV